jgi:hypothetical protein
VNKRVLVLGKVLEEIRVLGVTFDPGYLIEGSAWERIGTTTGERGYGPPSVDGFGAYLTAYIPGTVAGGWEGGEQ